ncbi:acyltransferase [Vibrio sp. F13]|uniref:acyltransferase n=1 Tax=Vibrio sp. F13 TaxID=2070777 RepID=UPI0010BE13D5|nr:acyltransferase [Vibrio sp. F13]TKF99452.1 acyltransferase [Vibrio sp. F13]
MAKGILPIWVFCTKAIRFVNLTVSKFKFKYVFSIKKRKGCYVGLGLRINNPKGITLYNNVSLADNVRMWSELPTGKLTLHDDVQINRNVLLDFSGKLVIGKNVLISEGAKIYTHTHGYDPRSRAIGNELIIAENAWIGTNAIILSSVDYIGKNSIIGSGAVVSKNVPDDCVYVCAPGRFIEKKRNICD